MEKDIIKHLDQNVKEVAKQLERNVEEIVSLRSANTILQAFVALLLREHPGERYYSREDIANAAQETPFGFSRDMKGGYVLRIETEEEIGEEEDD